MLSRSLLHLRRQCQQELIKSGKYTKGITNLYHKGSQGDKGSFWSEFVPFLIRASQRNHCQPHQAPQNQVTHEFDWQNFTDFIKRFDQRGPIQRNTEQDVIKETFESSVEDGILTLKADVEGKDEVAKKTIEIKFENKK